MSTIDFDKLADRVFAKFDKDGSGTIDKTELKPALVYFWDLLGMDDSQLDEYTEIRLNFADENKDGTLTQEEFKKVAKFYLEQL